MSEEYQTARNLASHGYTRPDQCLWCTSRRCRVRIVSECGTVNEVACSQHEPELCRLAGKWRGPTIYEISTGNLRRDSPAPAEAFAWARARYAALQEETT